MENKTGQINDTIFALGSAYGKAGVSVFRISGPGAEDILRKLARGKKFKPREMAFAKIYSKGGELIDSAMAAFFKAPHSYTGEDTAELFTHGSTAVIDAMYKALGEFKGARIAEPGEFTKRAFLNGKLDLAQVEAVADLIDAQTEAQRRQALRGLDGESSRLYEKWRGELVQILAYAEAAIDFSEDEMPTRVVAENEARLKNLAAQIKAHLKGAAAARMLCGGIDVAIVGKPNAGKSSLFNKILGMNRAIVSPKAGTTRDVIEASLDIGGFKINLMDTAGLSEKTADAIEKKGIAKARKTAKAADIKILVIDSARDNTDGADIVAFNKADRKKAPAGMLAVSAKTGQGVDRLLELLAAKIKEKAGAAPDTALSHERHKKALENCTAYLDEALKEPQPDLKAEALRAATNELASITGAVYFNELLDEIFSRFCLGK
jgi:tRNA modification GTPase